MRHSRETASNRSSSSPTVSALPRKRWPPSTSAGSSEGRCHRRLEVHEDVAAADQVEVGEGWIHRQVLAREYHRLAQRLRDAKAVVVLDEEARTRSSHVDDDAGEPARSNSSAPASTSDRGRMGRSLRGLISMSGMATE
jgi:hypothetical protein